jgi:hypothetical protein
VTLKLGAMSCSIPLDGPVGALVGKTDINPFRPAHIHFLIEEPGYRKLITHLFQEGAGYLDTDVVFGVKEALIVRFDEHPPELVRTVTKEGQPDWVALGPSGSLEMSGTRPGGTAARRQVHNRPVSSIIEFFVAPDGTAAAGVAERGAGGSFESATYGNFGVRSTLVE